MRELEKEEALIVKELVELRLNEYIEVIKGGAEDFPSNCQVCDFFSDNNRTTPECAMCPFNAYMEEVGTLGCSSKEFKIINVRQMLCDKGDITDSLRKGVVKHFLSLIKSARKWCNHYDIELDTTKYTIGDIHRYITFTV